MPNMNQIFLTGHIANDPELKYTNDGGGYTKFRLAVQREHQDETDFIQITVWNQGNYKLAEYVAESCAKGKLVTVVGELHIDEYNDQYYTSVRADKVIYERAQSEGGNQQTNNQPEDNPAEDDFDENIPF